MFSLITHQESLGKALNELDKGQIYQPLDIINNHVKEVVESVIPTMNHAHEAIHGYLERLKQSASYLEQSTKEFGASRERLLKDSDALIREAMQKLGTVEECCKIMMRCKDKLR